MLSFHRGSAAIALLTAALLAGCASDGSPVSTASVTEPTTARVDPACVSLAAQIDQLNKEGTPNRLAQAATGAGATVPVKRDALAKQAQLNKANADFRARCSTITPKPGSQSASAAPITPPAGATTAATKAASSAAAPAAAKAAAKAPAAATAAAVTAAPKAE